MSPDSPDFGPPQPCLVIGKEQTQIKHTQGAEALIAAHPVLLLVAVGDKMSHLHIKKKKLFSCPCQVGQRTSLRSGHLS